MGVAGVGVVKADKFCNQLEWVMSGNQFRDDFMVMNVGFFDLILGAQWLAKLGRFLLDMENCFMAFNYQGRYYELTGIKVADTKPWLVPSLTKEQHDFDKLLHCYEGSENAAGDALSCLPEAFVSAITCSRNDLLQRVKDSWTTDNHIQHIISDLELDPTAHSHYTWHNGLLNHKGFLVVGADQHCGQYPHFKIVVPSADPCGQG